MRTQHPFIQFLETKGEIYLAEGVRRYDMAGLESRDWRELVAEMEQYGEDKQDIDDRRRLAELREEFELK